MWTFSKNPLITKVRDDAMQERAPTPTVTKFAASRRVTLLHYLQVCIQNEFELAFLSRERGRFKSRGTSHFLFAVFDSFQYTIVENIFVETIRFAEHCRNHLLCWTHNRRDCFWRIHFHWRSHCSHTHKLLPWIPCICNTFCWLKQYNRYPSCLNVWNDMRRPVIHFSA